MNNSDLNENNVSDTSVSNVSESSNVSANTAQTGGNNMNDTNNENVSTNSVNDEKNVNASVNNVSDSTVNDDKNVSTSAENVGDSTVNDDRNVSTEVNSDSSRASAAPRRPAKIRRSDVPAAGKLVALVVSLCLMCSAVFGVGGAFVASRLMTSTSSAVTATTTTSATASNAASGASDTSKSASLDYNTASDSASTANTDSSEATVVTASAKASPSVVEITTESSSTSSYFGQYVTEGAGSGVIISSDGYILTCNHVVDGATAITVTTKDGTKYEATVVGTDDQTDIAVLKIDATGLTAATVGSSSSLVVGQTAIAIGNPLGELGGTVTTGIISALDREVTIEGQSYTLLQTSAAINPGNSGGGLFDINGNLIGIVNAKSSSSSSSEGTIEGLGFAIPIDTAISVANELVKYGYVEGRPSLGISVYEVSTSTTSSSLYSAGMSNLLNYVTDYGVYFTGYADGVSGDLQYGDRIAAVNGVEVSTLAELKSAISSLSIGDTVTLTVARLSSTSGRNTQSNMIDVKATLIEKGKTTTSASAETSVQ